MLLGHKAPFYLFIFLLLFFTVLTKIFWLVSGIEWITNFQIFIFSSFLESAPTFLVTNRGHHSNLTPKDPSPLIPLSTCTHNYSQYSDMLCT